MDTQLSSGSNYFVYAFIHFHISYMTAEKALTRLCRFPALSDPSLLACAKVRKSYVLANLLLVRQTV